MTVVAQIPVSGPHIADGVGRSWPFTFRVSNVAHMSLLVTDADGSNPVVVTSGFTIADGYLNQDAGGYIEYPISPVPALAAGKRVWPYRTAPYEQAAKIGNQGGFFPETHERAFDAVSMQVQQLAERIGRAVVVNFGSTLDPDELLADLEAAVTQTEANAAASALSASEADADRIATEAARDEVLAAIAALGGPMVYQGGWDASAGTFPGTVGRKKGWAYTVTTGGTVGGQVFETNDTLVAVVDNASTTVYGGNWLRIEADLVQSVAGLTGAISAAALKTALGFPIVDADVATPGAPADGVNATKIRFQRTVALPNIILSERLKDLPFLEDWGGVGVAVGGSVVNNAAAFTAALAEVGAGGLILLHPKLVYGSASKISLNNGQMIEGWQQQGYDFFGATPVADSGAIIQWMGGAGTLMEVGADDAPVFTDKIGGGLRNLMLYGANAAARVLKVKAIHNAVFENLKIAYPNGGFALELGANPTTQGSPFVHNTIRGCSFRNINIFNRGNGYGIYNVSNGVEGGITQCNFDNIVVQFGYDGVGHGVYLSSMDSSFWKGLKVIKGAGTNTGSSIVLDGTTAGKQVQGNEFAFVTLAGENSTVYYDGPTSRMNKMLISAIDYEPTILKGPTLTNASFPSSTGAELEVDYLGTSAGGTGTLQSDKSYRRSAPVQLREGLLTTTKAGLHEYSGKAFYGSPKDGVRAVIPSVQFTKQAADRAGSDANTAQAVFDAAQDTFTLESDTAYEFEAEYMISRAAGTTSHTTGVLFGGAAVLTNIDYIADVSNPTGNVLGAVSQIVGSAATETVLTPANTSATENLRIKLKGTVRVTTGGTFIPQFKYSAAPGGAPTIKRNSSFRIWPVGNAAVALQGAVA